MLTSKDIYIANRQDAKLHWNDCTIETETDRINEITTAHCIEHLVDVSSCLPEYEPDQYDNSQENLDGR